MTDENKIPEERALQAFEFRTKTTTSLINREWESAINYATEAIRLWGDDNIDACTDYQNRGNAYYQKKDWDNSINDYTQAINISGSDKNLLSYLHNVRGNVYYSKSDFNKAINDYIQAIEIGNDDKNLIILIHNNLGNIYYMQGKWDKSLETQNQAIAIAESISANNEYTAASYYNRGNVFQFTHRFTEAIQDYQAAISMRGEDNPLSANYYNNLGATYDKSGDLENAATHFRKATELHQNTGSNPDHALAHANLGSINKRLNNYKEAISNFSTAIEIYESQPAVAPAYLTRGEIYQDSGQYLLAIEDYIKASNFYGNNNIPHGFVFRVWVAQQCKANSITNNQTLGQLMNMLQALYDEIEKILNERHLKAGFSNSDEENKNEFVHYTSLETLRALTSLDDDDNKTRPSFESGSAFRIYDILHTNDPSEGKILIEKLRESHLHEFFNFDKDIPSPIITCVGSFVIHEKGLRKNYSDDLTLWRFYGKHESIEGGGCNLIYTANSFSEEQIGIASALLISNESSGDNSPDIDNIPKAIISDNSFTTQKQPIYAVTYLSPDDAAPPNIVQALESAKADIENWVADEKLLTIAKNAVRAFIVNVSFLYKSSNYEDESEARVIVRALPDKALLDKMSDKTSPRAYFELAKDFIPNRITIGPTAPDGWDVFLQRHLAEVEEKKVEIVKSKIPFDPKG